MMKLFLYIFACCLLVAQTGQQPKTKQQEKYDPDNLGPGEVACGRLSSKKAPPCGCIKHRNKVIDEAMDKCQFIDNKSARMDCYKKVPQCGDVPVVDAESWTYTEEGTVMPPQCKRTCRKARCECCHS